MHLELNNITGKINLKSIQIRNFTYVASDYASLIRRGKKYTDEVKVLAIDLTYGLSKKKDLIRQFSYQDKYGEKYIDNLETIVINMDKAMNFWYDKNTKEIENYKHLIMLDMNKEELKNLAKGDDLVMEYSKKVTDLNENPQFRKIMSAEEDYEKLQRTYLDNAKEIGYLSGVKEGHASGIKEGHTSGVKDGQQIERKNIINSMLKNGMPIKEISKCTDLSIEEINSLIN